MTLPSRTRQPSMLDWQLMPTVILVPARCRSAAAGRRCRRAWAAQSARSAICTIGSSRMRPPQAADRLAGPRCPDRFRHCDRRGSRRRTATTPSPRFFARFRLTGWKRVVNELVSEALTLGVGGLAVLYVLAIPALNDFDENNITTGKYAVKFIDRNGTEIGQRGILHNDAIELRGDPRSPHQGHARHRGPPLLRALRRRRVRHRARAVRERARQRGGAGRLHHHPAARQEPVPVLRALARAQDQGGVSRPPARGALHEVPDPQDVSRSRLSGRRRVRGGGGLAVLFRQVRARDQPGGVGAARRPVQGAHALCAARQPAGVARPHQRGADQPGGSRLHEPRARCTPPASTPPARSSRASRKAPTGSWTGRSRRFSASPRARASSSSPRA